MSPADGSGLIISADNTNATQLKNLTPCYVFLYESTRRTPEVYYLPSRSTAGTTASYTIRGNYTFNPVFVMLTYVDSKSDNSSTQYLFYPLNRGSIYSYERSSQQYYLIVNWGDRKISWYENYSVRFNRTGVEYKYIAIGY